MNEEHQRLQQLLHEIAQEEIDENMNLWPAIRAQLNDSKARRLKFPFYLGRIASLLLALILVSTAGYALYLNQLGGSRGDPGIVGVSEAELITPLNLTQTINNVNVTLIWGYADGNRISVAYEVEYSDTLRPPELSNIILRGADGNAIPGAAYLGGSGGGGGGGDGRLMYGSVASFDSTSFENTPDSIDLTVEMIFAGAPDGPHFPSLGIPNKTVPDQSGDSGGGGNSGGSEPSGNSDDSSAGETIPPFNVTFEFSLPFIPAAKIQTPQSISANGITVEIANASIAPSVSLMDLCYDVSSIPEDENASAWRPRFIIGGEVAASSSFEPNLAASDETRTCGEAVITDLFIAEDGQLSLTIDRLQTDAILDLDRIQDFVVAVQEMGIEVVFDIRIEGESVSMGFSSVSEFGIDDTTYATINQLYDDLLRDKIEGPWTFTFDVP